MAAQGQTGRSPATTREAPSSQVSPGIGSIDDIIINSGKRSPSDTNPQPGTQLDFLRTEEARKVQQRLADLGFLGGNVDGMWTRRSRQALREFKTMSGLPRDDAWDQSTEAQLFAQEAQRKGTNNPVRNSPSTAVVAETNYPAPMGATINPLNRADAAKIQTRLADLGFFFGQSDGVWGPASRNALREFKVINGLTADDSWDGDTERALRAEQAIRSSTTFVGTWALDAGDCQSPQGGGAVLRISLQRAVTSAGVCEFGPALHEGVGWRVRAVCTAGGRTWNANVTLSVSNDRLTWSSENGPETYVRCRAN